MKICIIPLNDIFDTNGFPQDFDNIQILGCSHTAWVHPRKFKEYVRDLSKNSIVYTLNPFLVNEYDYNSIFFEVERGKFVALTKNKLYMNWKDQLSPGEFWSFVGNDWCGEEEFIGYELLLEIVKNWY